MMKRSIDILVLSDVHLGSIGSKAQELLRYLKSVHPKTLILNGDFIDLWEFKKKYFPKSHMQVIHHVLKLSLSGTKVYYITGNHDDSLRGFSDFTAGTFNLKDQLVLQIKNEKYWFFHGDIFDSSVSKLRWIAKMGAKGYTNLIRLDKWINRMRARLGFSPRLFAAKWKKRVKNAVKYINDFENKAIIAGQEEGFDYVVCGHIHQPRVYELNNEKGKIIYLNSGDWVENMTALEYVNQKWSLFYYQEKPDESTNTATTQNNGRHQSDSDQTNSSALFPLKNKAPQISTENRIP